MLHCKLFYELVVNVLYCVSFAPVMSNLVKVKSLNNNTNCLRTNLDAIQREKASPEPSLLILKRLKVAKLKKKK